MGNCYYQTVEFQNYKRIKNDTSSREGRQFMWGCKENEKSFFYFVDMVTKKVHPLSLDNVKLFNLAGTLQLDNNRIFACGGVSYSMQFITRSAYIYHIDKHVFKPVANLIEERFNFPLVYHENKIYAIGGQRYGLYEDAISNACEVYFMDTNTWQSIAPLNHARSGSKAIIYRGKIWVFGGKNFNKKGRVIEIYDQIVDRWTELDIRLPFDYFDFGVLSFEHDKIHILAGANGRGMSRNVHQIDLEKRTIINKGCFLTRRSGFKLFYWPCRHEALIFGGASNINDLTSNFAEIYSFKTTRSKSIYIHNALLNNESTELFNNNIQQVSVTSELKTSIAAFDNKKLINKYESKNYLFGTDNEPFLLSIDSQTMEVKIKAIPWNLKLKNHQGAIRLDNNRVFFTGGVNYLFNKVYDRCFIYDLKDKKVEKLPNMHRIRFFFSIMSHKEYIYVMGGRSYGNDRESIMADCERFCTKEKAWKIIAPLNKPRCQATSFVFKDRLYVTGGLRSKGVATKTIEIYNEQKDRWEVLGTSLNEGLMGLTSMNFNDEHVILIGGIDYFISQYIYKLSMDRGADLAEWTAVPINCKHYLSKICKLQDYFMVFGGLNDDLEYFNAKDFSKAKNSEAFKQFTGLLIFTFSEVNRENYGLTKCSFVNCYH